MAITGMMGSFVLGHFSDEVEDRKFLILVALAFGATGFCYSAFNLEFSDLPAVILSAFKQRIWTTFCSDPHRDQCARLKRFGLDQFSGALYLCGFVHYCAGAGWAFYCQA